MIYDIDNNPLPSYLMNLDGSGIFQFTIRINAKAGKYLRSESVSDLLVEGRHEGDSSWINLETTGIDTSAFDGTRTNYEIRLTADAVSTHVTHSFKIYVAT